MYLATLTTYTDCHSFLAKVFLYEQGGGGHWEGMPMDRVLLSDLRFEFPFTPRADRQYAIAQWAPGQTEPIMSWYFATQ